MDVTIAGPYFDNKKWKLEVINNCRIHLKIFLIGEVTDDGTNIKTGIMDGSFINEESQVNFVSMQKPPPVAWNEWRSFVFCNFVSGKKELFPPITKTLQRTVDYNTCNKVYIEQKGTLKEMFDSMPKHLRDLMGKIDLPQDQGKTLINDLMKSQAMGASNGSLNSTWTQGSYEYFIGSQHSNDKMIWGGEKKYHAPITLHLSQQ